jgi:hypothetical protein
MARTPVVVKTKITEQFTAVGDGGEEYNIQEHTRCETKSIEGKKTEVLGRAYLLTADGRGVLKTDSHNVYSIPSLNLRVFRKNDATAT